MTIIDEAALNRVRNLPRCEWCGKENRTGLHAAHLFARGMGGGRRLDHPYCLNGLCWECHDDWHHGLIPKCSLVAIIAKREGVSADEVERKVYELLRTPNRPIAERK